MSLCLLIMNDVGKPSGSISICSGVPMGKTDRVVLGLGHKKVNAIRHY